MTTMPTIIRIWCVLALASMVAANQRPHIILMLADDLAWGDVSYHKNQSDAEILTPRIDELAAAGVKMENYYVQPTCSPTRSQLMTGRYQIHTGLMHGVIKPTQPSCLPLEERILPQYLKDYDYATHIVGKWHLGMYKPACRPTNRGFDSHFGILLGSGGYYSHKDSYYMKSEKRYLSGRDFRFTNSTTDNKLQENYEGLYATEVYANRSKDIIKEYANDAAASLPPLFLYVAFQTPHKPLEVPDKYVDIYRSGNLSGTRKQYAGMVSALDNAVGEIVDALKEAGIYNDSVIIFSTDNGGAGQPSTNWPLRGAKHTLWEGGIRGVGFVTSPKYIPNCKVGTVNYDLIHVSDWLPTIIEGALGETIAAPSDPNKELDGYNVWQYFTRCEVNQTIRSEILYNIDPFYMAGRIRNTKYDSNGKLIVSDVFSDTWHAALRVGGLKLLTGNPGYKAMGHDPPPESNITTPTETLDSSQTVQLFNITADPYEKIDLSGVMQTTVTEMSAKIADYWESSKRADIIYPQEEAEADPALLDDGYWGPWRNNDESLIV